MTPSNPDKHILCLACRCTFAEADVTGPTCPGCGDRGVPADTRKTHAITLTDLEWRVLFLWAERWADQHDTSHPDGACMLRALGGIAREARRQQPTMPNLSLLADVQDIATITGRPATLVRSDGAEATIMPMAKN